MMSHCHSELECLLPSRSAAWDEALSLYRHRDEAENQFDMLKNELEMLPLRVRAPFPARPTVHLLRRPAAPCQGTMT